MLWLNRILNILLLIFAITSLVLGYMLFERRQALRNHGEKLADNVAQITKALDENSGTKLSDVINRREFTTGDGKSLPGGTLGWAYFHESQPEFDKTLEKVKKQTSDIRDQRDALAATLAEIATLFNYPENDPTTFQDITKFEGAKQVLLENLKGVREREDAIVLKIEELAKKIGTPIDRGAISDPENFDKPFADIALEVKKLKERLVNVSDALVQAVAKIDAHHFEANPQMLKDDNEYAGQLSAMLNDFATINDKLKDYEKYKVDLLETKENREKTQIALESCHDNLAALENKYANLTTEHSSLKTGYNELVGVASKPEDSQLQKLEGKILEVDYDWNYVVVNLGKKDNLPENLEMTVAREQEYICKVLVTKVYKDYSVAEILPKLKEGSVIEGDRVIF